MAYTRFCSYGTGKGLCVRECGPIKACKAIAEMTPKMTKAQCVRANADASPACTEQCRGCSFMQGTLEMLPLQMNRSSGDEDGKA